MSSNLKTFLAFGAIYVIWGSTYLAIRYAVETIPPFFMMGVRSLSAGLILYIWSRSRGHDHIERGDWPALALIGASFFLVGHGLLAWAQQRVPSGLAALLVTSEPLWILTIEFLFLRDIKVKMRGIIGLIVGFAGIVFLITSTKDIDTSQADVVASLAIVVGALSWSGGAVYARVAKLPKSAVLSAGMQLVFGGAFLLVAGLILGEGQALQTSTLSWRSVLSLGYLIVFGSVVTFSAYIWLLGRTSATRVSTHTYVNPVIAVILGWLVADEPLTSELLISVVVIVVSVFLVLSDQSDSSSLPSNAEPS